MPELDHLIFAATELATGVSHIEALTGTRPEPGGPHPGVGTHNALLTFDTTIYFEVIAIDPDQPEPGRPRPFGLTAETTPTLAGFAVHPAPGETIEHVAERMQALGHDPGPVASMSRTKPDGTEIAWQLTQPSDGVIAGVAPFVIGWGDTPSPATTLPSMGSLTELQVSHPDAGTRAMIDGLELGPIVVTVDGPASLTATVETPSGTVTIA